MKKFKIILEDREGHKQVFETVAFSRAHAELVAIESLKENDEYNYKVIDCLEEENPDETQEN